MALTHTEANQFQRLLAWKQGWVKAGRPTTQRGETERLFDYGTVEQLTQHHPEMLTTEQKADITQLYADQAPIKQIAAKFGVHRATVRTIAKATNLPPHPRGLTEAQIAQAATMYESGASLATVGHWLAVNAGTVRRALLDRGVVMRPQQGGRRRTL